MSNLFAELKRRNVFRVAAAYVVSVWLFIEIAQVLLEIYEAPGWVSKILVGLLVLGLPLVIAFSWAYELTPEGIKREKDVSRDESITHRTARRLDGITIALLILAMGMMALDWFWLGDLRRPAPATGSPVAADTRAAPSVTLPEVPADKSIAVLPFENLSSDEDNAFFASGVHEDILTYLTKVEDLRVISRTSVLKYAGEAVNLRAVARDLGVSHILEGSVRRAGDRVRVTAQLIDARSDEHLWAENFDRDLSDIFEIQTQVAQEIVHAIGAQLSPGEAERISRKPTDSVAAYDLYLKAREALRNAVLSEAPELEAQRLLLEAIEIDPQFAHAYALLARVHGSLYWAYDRSPGRLASMKSAIDKAFEIQPDLPEARLALADYYYRGFYDYPSALAQLEIARQLIPNDAQVFYQLGLTLRRVGRWDDSIAAFGKARRLDPANPKHVGEQLVTVTDAMDWEAGWRILADVERDYPDDTGLAARSALFILAATGDAERARARLAGHAPTHGWYDAEARMEIEYWARHPAAGIVAVEQGRKVFEVLTPGYPELHLGNFHALAGDLEAAREVWRLAVPKLVKAGEERPDFVWPHAVRALALAQLGDAEGTREACARTPEILPASRDKVHGLTIEKYCIRARARIGDRDYALAELSRLLNVANGFNPIRLGLHPEWDFFRDDPRFRALYEGDPSRGQIDSTSP